MTNVDEWWGDPIRIYTNACHDEYEHSNSNIWTETLGTLSSPPRPTLIKIMTSLVLL